MAQCSLQIANLANYQGRGFDGAGELADASSLETCDFLYFCLSSGFQPHLQLVEAGPNADPGAAHRRNEAERSEQVVAVGRAPSIAMSDTDYDLRTDSAESVTSHSELRSPFSSRHTTTKEAELELAQPSLPAERTPSHFTDSHDVEQSPTHEQSSTARAGQQKPAVVNGAVSSAGAADDSLPDSPEPPAVRVRKPESEWVDGDAFFAAKAARIRASQAKAKAEAQRSASRAAGPMKHSAAASPARVNGTAAMSPRTPRLAKDRKKTPATPVTPRVIVPLDGQGHIRRRAPQAEYSQSRQNQRMNAFTWSATESTGFGSQPGRQKLAEIAHLVGINKVFGQGGTHFRESLNAEFFRRRSRFRRSMRTHILKAQDMRAVRGPFDLPGYWTRPSLSHTEANSAELCIGCIFAGTDFACEIECVSTQRMLEVLKQIHRQCVVAVPESTPATPAGLVLKVRGMHDFLDGDECLSDYGYLRQCISKQEKPRVTILTRESIVAECKDQQAETLNEDDLEEGSDTDDDTVDYDEIENDFEANGDKTDWKFIPIAELHRNFRIRIVGVDQLPATDKADKGAPKGHHGKPAKDKSKERATELIFINVGLYYGGELLHGTETHETTKQPRVHNPRWDEWLNFDFAMSRLPRATRLCFTVTNHKLYKSGEARDSLGWVNLNLFDDANRLRTGQIGLRLWQTIDPETGLKQAANPIGTCVDNLAAEDPSIIFIELDEYHTTVLHPRAGNTPLVAR